jgi:hypothetical protein
VQSGRDYRDLLPLLVAAVGLDDTFITDRATRLAIIAVLEAALAVQAYMEARELTEAQRLRFGVAVRQLCSLLLGGIWVGAQKSKWCIVKVRVDRCPARRSVPRRAATARVHRMTRASRIPAAPSPAVPHAAAHARVRASARRAAQL